MCPSIPLFAAEDYLVGFAIELTQRGRKKRGEIRKRQKMQELERIPDLTFHKVSLSLIIDVVASKL